MRGPPSPSAGRSAAWVRSLRAPKRPVDAFAPLSWFWETERGAPAAAPAAPAASAASDPSDPSDPSAGAGCRPEDPGIAVLTMLLAGAECPYSCVFCDLWRETLDGPTPRGALPAQLRAVLAQAGRLPEPCATKLYNASNFFDQRAVPVEDEPQLAELLSPFAPVTVECHPRLVGDRCLAFAGRLGGRLEVAMGLESIHPRALPRLNKAMTLADFDRAAAALRGAGIGLRAFVLVGTPYVPPAEALEWTVRTAAHAFERGAARVALIPVRGGNGALEELRRHGEFAPPTLADLEAALDRCLALGGGVVAADLWDGGRLAACSECATPRLERLARINRTGVVEPRPRCAGCGGS